MLWDSSPSSVKFSNTHHEEEEEEEEEVEERQGSSTNNHVVVALAAAGTYVVTYVRFFFNVLSLSVSLSLTSLCVSTTRAIVYTITQCSVIVCAC